MKATPQRKGVLTPAQRQKGIDGLRNLSLDPKATSEVRKRANLQLCNQLKLQKVFARKTD